MTNNTLRKAPTFCSFNIQLTVKLLTNCTFTQIHSTITLSCAAFNVDLELFSHRGNEQHCVQSIIINFTSAKETFRQSMLQPGNTNERVPWMWIKFSRGGCFVVAAFLLLSNYSYLYRNTRPVDAAFPLLLLPSKVFFVGLLKASLVNSIYFVIITFLGASGATTDAAAA